MQGNEEMRMHFRHDVDVRKVMALVRDCMGSAKVQRNVLEVVLGIVLEAKYDAQQAVSQIVNADAAPLFFRMLMQVCCFVLFLSLSVLFIVKAVYVAVLEALFYFFVSCLVVACSG